MKIKHLLLMFGVLSSPVAAAAETTIEVIPVLNRAASDIQPLLSPLLEYTDWAGADGPNLVVKTTPGRLGQIKALIEQLDTPQHDLIITVIQGYHTTADRLNAATRIQLDHATNNPAKSSLNINSRYFQTQDNSANESTQTIRTLEGNTAYIKTGNTYPIQNVQINAGAYGYPRVSTNTGFIAATTGFAVTPRLAGQEVILDITPWSDNMNAKGQIETQGTQTKIKVNPGEWVELGAASEHDQSNTRSAHTWQTGESSLHILVKVDKATDH
ncbi:MAG: hypothetical protein Q8N96_14440 [Methylovulum sp.]|nr:hypothetical protein [Methylovulum sp.]